MKDPDILLAVKPVVEAFEQLSIPYFIGGSVASSVYGFARATMDFIGGSVASSVYGFARATMAKGQNVKTADFETFARKSLCLLD